MNVHKNARLTPAGREVLVRRYEREAPGDMIHIDIKKLSHFNKAGHRITGDRTGHSNTGGVGWEYVHVCIDDASRVAFSRIMPDEKGEGPSFRRPSFDPWFGVRSRNQTLPKIGDDHRHG
jgi:hypothetical protein